ncbi:hypothetical protein CEXT_533641 [Caerostris extrusa]|uniref:Uncharacterized protein n=1 Tax=Caerostris extrusa TaxID=172846 RepID=A0AAV4NUL2_CAEEX|nr:hypothetical protein CEXT_533641 [Caerostris extrusa]
MLGSLLSRNLSQPLGCDSDFSATSGDSRKMEMISLFFSQYIRGFLTFGTFYNATPIDPNGFLLKSLTPFCRIDSKEFADIVARHRRQLLVHFQPLMTVTVDRHLKSFENLQCSYICA